MKHVARHMFFALAILTLASSALAVPQLINYQGALSDSSDPVNGDVSITFNIYNAPAAGDVLWSETQTVSVTDGVFSVLLGSQTPFPADLLMEDERYLGVQVDTDPEMAPRQRLASVPFALRALSAACTPGDFINCYTGTPDTRNVGECVSGLRICGPEETFGTCEGEVTPLPELCDTLDNDCNPGTADGSGEPNIGNLCDGADSDLCKEGTVECSGGVLACTDSTSSSIDTCDGTDDDCDPASPDGSEEPTIDDLCDGPDSDLCTEGTIVCTGVGGLACSDSTGDTLDLCNGDTNDDCNSGTPDGADEQWWGTACDGTDTDLCEDGLYVCSSGTKVCFDFGDTLEFCGDGIDNDCDGQTDEDCSIQYIFVTFPIYHGYDLGSGMADTYCQNNADSGTFTSGLGATWKAIISTSTVNAKDHVSVLWPVYNTHGDLIARDATDLWDGSIENAVSYDASGAAMPLGFVWTGSNPDGTYTLFNCGDWQTSSGTAIVGNNNESDFQWIASPLPDNCNATRLNALYCISSAIPQ